MEPSRLRGLPPPTTRNLDPAVERVAKVHIPGVRASGEGADIVAAWCASAVFGLSLTVPPASIPAAAAALIDWTLLELKDSAALPALLAQGEPVVRQFTRDADMLGEVVRHLVTTARLITAPDLVGSVVLPLLSGLDKDAHSAALQHFFTMP